MNDHRWPRGVFMEMDVLVEHTDFFTGRTWQTTERRMVRIVPQAAQDQQGEGR